MGTAGHVTNSGTGFLVALLRLEKSWLQSGQIIVAQRKLWHPSLSFCSVQFTQKTGIFYVASSVVDPLHVAVWEMRGATVVKNWEQTSYPIHCRAFTMEISSGAQSNPHARRSVSHKGQHEGLQFETLIGGIVFTVDRSVDIAATLSRMCYGRRPLFRDMSPHSNRTALMRFESVVSEKPFETHGSPCPDMERDVRRQRHVLQIAEAIRQPCRVSYRRKHATDIGTSTYCRINNSPSSQPPPHAQDPDGLQYPESKICKNVYIQRLKLESRVPGFPTKRQGGSSQQSSIPTRFRGIKCLGDGRRCLGRLESHPGMVWEIADGIQQSAVRRGKISLPIEGAWKGRTVSRVADFVDLIVRGDIIETDLR